MNAERSEYVVIVDNDLEQKCEYLNHKICVYWKLLPIQFTEPDKTILIKQKFFAFDLTCKYFTFFYKTLICLENILV